MVLLIKSQNFSRYGKLGLLILLVVLLIFIIKNGVNIRDVWNAGSNNDLLDTQEVTIPILDADIISCLKKLNREDLIKGFESKHPVHPKPILKFHNLISSLNIKTVAIEPSFLYCLLRPTHQDLLFKRKFNISTLLGSKRTFTFGIKSKDFSILVEDENADKFRKDGFLPYFHYSEIADWMRSNKSKNEMENKETFVSHIFYTYFYWTFHIVVFQERNDYFWLAEFFPKEKQGIPQRNKLLFVDHNSAFEYFTFISLVSKSQLLLKFYIPSNPHFFLFEIPTSHFLECDASNLKTDNTSSPVSKAHGHLSVDEFNTRLREATEELKTLFNSLLMHFWIFAGTMLGWYRECSTIPFTTDVDFGAWAAEIDDLAFLLKFFRNNKKLYIKQRMGILEQALEFRLIIDRLFVDVFFLYQINNGSWASGHRPSGGYFFKYYYPPFTLCSAELLKMKVLVPCETESVIKTEYGPGWRKPVPSWYYESSIFNRGPNIYWEDNVRNDTYQEY